MRLTTCVAAIAFLGVANHSYAGVVVGASRIIYDGTKKESSIFVENPDDTGYLIQTWVDDSEKGKKASEFIVTPPLFRLDDGLRNTIRIFKTKELPSDRESLFWLNVKAIPETEKKENSLQFAVKHRIKLIYRPESLKTGSPERLADKLEWRTIGEGLQVNNPTPFYMNFASVTINNKKIKDALWVGPYSKASFTLPSFVEDKKVKWKLISDYGAAGPEHSSVLY